MPVYDIDLSDGRTVTVESETEPTDEQVLGALQTQEVPVEEPRFTQNLGQVLSAPQPELPPQTIPYTGIPESMAPMVDWERFQAGPTFAEERTTGVPSAAGLTPEVVPSGHAVSEVMQGIPATSLPFEPIRGVLASEIPATLTSSVAKTGIGLAEYLSSLQGVTEFVASMTPARLLVMAKWAVDMAKGAGQEAGALSALLGKPNKTRDDWQTISDHAVNTAAMVFGAGATARGVARPVTRALTPAKVKAAQELSRLLETTKPMGTVQPRQPIRQLGIPQAALTAEPFLQPGIPELAGQALREAQSPLTVPGRTPAIEMLRSELAPPEVVPVESRLAGRIPERGGTMVTPTLEGVQVQPRVLRSASDILLERFVGREPMAPEPLPIPPEVQAAGMKAEAPTAPAKAPPAKPAEAPKVEPEIARGDTILWRPKNAREARVQGDVQGMVVEVIRNPDGDIGYEILAPLEGDPGRVLRVWAERGNVEVKARAPVEEKPSQVQPSGVGETGTVQRRKSVVEIADEIAKQGVDPQASYGLFVKERQLKPEIDAKEWLPIYKNSLELEKLRKQIEVTKRFSQQPTPSAKVEAPPAEPPGAPREMRSEPHTEKDFLEIGRIQRGRPEFSMGAIHEAAPGVTGFVAEHLGDILHRMNDWNTFESAGYEYVTEKVNKTLRSLTDKYGFDKEHKENIAAKARYDRIPLEQVQREMDKALSDYAKEYKSIPTFNKAQQVAKDAAVAFGNKDWHSAIINLEELKRHLNTEQEWKSYAHEGLSKSTIAPTVKPDLISKLESLKFKEGQEGTSFSLPHPDAIKAIGISTWNSAVEIAIASVKAGKAFAKAIDDAIAYLRKNVRGLDETQARANLEYIAREETQPSVQIPSTEGETIKMRKSAERATTSPMVPEPVQERIAKAPESFYPQQVVPRVEDVVESMTDAQLAAIPKESNVYVAGRLKLIDRLFQRGDLNAGYNVFVELEKGGTTMGQLINQFKLLKGSRPENVIRLLNEKLKRAGKDVLNPEQQTRALEKVVLSKQKDAALDKATNDWLKEPSLENAEAAEKALLEANAAALDLQRFTSKFQPRSTASILKSILQAGLLTPISEVANVVGNMSFNPFRSADRTIATSLDILDNYLLGTERQITVQPIRGTAEAFKGFGRGVKQIPDIFLRGPGDVVKGETRAGLHPIQAWINQFVSNPDMPTTGGKLTTHDRLNLFIEGTLGIPTEPMLRGLSAGDIAYREAAKARSTATELSLAKVPKDQWSFAQKFPELFLKEAALERINEQTTLSVFQRRSKTLDVITNRIRGIGEWFDLMVATIAPYKLTPWNIVGEILSYNPLVAFTRSLNDIRVGNRLAAKLNTGKYIVGSMLATAGWWLYSKGLLSPSLDQRDEQQKNRIMAGEVIPPNHINFSGLNRAMEKFRKFQKPTIEDTAFRPGDDTRDVFRAGGLAGSMFYMMANIGRDFERKPEVANSEIWQSILTQSTLEQARFGMNQSFLSGVEGLLSAVREGNTDNYVRQWGNTVASIPFPNTLTVLSRATREFKPDFREDTFRKQMENVIRNKLGFAGLDDYLPLQRGLWGEPIRETPEGRNAILYHFFDVTKGKQVTSDPAKLELFRLWRKTADNRIFPSIPERQITVQSKNYPLNTEQYSRYAELVGKERKRIFDAIVVNPQFHKLSDEAKVAGLDRIYRAGLDAGKEKFWKERGATLIPKPPRAGFAPAP